LSNGGRCLGLVLTHQGAAGAPLRRCGRRGHQGGVLRFVLTAAGTAVSRFSIRAPVLRLTTPASAIGRLCLAKRNPR
jgi:hypothetical protein